MCEDGASPIRGLMGAGAAGKESVGRLDGSPQGGRHAGPGTLSEATRLRTYSAELKDRLMAKMLAPDNISVPQLVRETGIPRDTLYGWRRQAVNRGAAAAVSATPVGPWSSEARSSRRWRRPAVSASWNWARTAGAKDSSPNSSTPGARPAARLGEWR